MINLVIDSTILRQVLSFTKRAKDDVRPQLNAISLKNVNGKLELTATDGAGLIKVTRPFKENESLTKDLVLKFGSLPKSFHFLVIGEENNKVVAKNLSNNDIIPCEVLNLTYPRYEVIFPSCPIEDLPFASEFVLFDGKRLSKIEDIIGYRHPRAFEDMGAIKAHFWTYKENEYSYEFALMPVHCRK